ncbi:unnamed protein product [Sphagnum troendelagicum]|uniref:Uncharacterized protein n=1 Tax=Sphagnum troendelagicum TaxID=128251 RepID=A0ABP0U8T3_9BRYO
MSQSVRGFRTEEKSQQQGLPPHISVGSVFTELKGKYCAFGGGVTLVEAGGSGGNIGKKSFNGGGDDDDYFREDGDDDGGDDGGLFGGRLAVPEIFDQKVVAAVLQEWFRQSMLTW